MHFNSNELTLIYDHNHEKGRKTLAYAQSIAPRVNKQELNTVRISDTLFELMLDRLQMPGKNIINKSDPYYQECCKGRDLSAGEWLEILRKRPDMLRAPIALYKDKAIICDVPSDILKVL